MGRTKSKNSFQSIAEEFINNPTQESFAKVYEKFYYGLRDFVEKYVGRREDAENIVIKTFETVWQKYEQYNKQYNFSTWLYTIAKNYSLQFLNKKNSMNMINNDISEIFSSSFDSNYFMEPEDSISFQTNIHGKSYTKEIIISDLYDASLNAINKLPDNLKIVMYERLVNNKKIDLIAEDNNMTIASVKNWLRKGKQEMQNIIMKEHPDICQMYIDSQL